MKIELKPGESLLVTLAESALSEDEGFEIRYGLETVEVVAPAPDDRGRDGVIYRETYGPADGEDEGDEPQPDPNPGFRRWTEKDFDDFASSALAILQAHEAEPLDAKLAALLGEVTSIEDRVCLRSACPFRETSAGPGGEEVPSRRPPPPGPGGLAVPQGGDPCQT